MKRLRSLAAAAAVLALAGPAAAAEQTLTTKVTGWHCGDCVTKTVASVKKLAGVKDATGDVEAGTLKVTYEDSKVDRKKIETAVAASGFKCDEAK